MGWPKRYTLIGLCFLASFVCYIDRVNMSVAVLAMQERFGWSETVKGFVLSSFFVGYLLFQIPSGYLASRFGGRLVLGLAVLWWSICTVITPEAATLSLALLIVTRIAMGMGEAATFPASYNLFSRWVPASERSRAVSLLLSGIPAGTVFAFVVSGWIIVNYGWPTVFYLFGSAGFFWSLLWFSRTHDSPASHPRISAEERALLSTSTGRGVEKVVVPWGRLLREPAVWALIINHFCSNWALYMLMTWLPSYFKQAQGMSIPNAGLLSAAPWLTMFAMTNVAAWSADALVRRGKSTLFVRKTMQVIGLVGPAIFLLAALGAGSAASAVLLMCGALGTLAFTWSGYAPNHLEIAPRYADVLFGVTNTAGTIPGIAGVVVTGWLVDTTGSYSAPFLLAAAVNIAGAVIWLLFATTRRVVD